MPLKDRITEDMKAAMRAKDRPRLSAVRLLLAAMKQKEVDERVELADPDVLAIIEKMIKQRRESIAQYESAGRKDLADIEQFELKVLSGDRPETVASIARDAGFDGAAIDASDLPDDPAALRASAGEVDAVGRSLSPAAVLAAISLASAIVTTTRLM